MSSRETDLQQQARSAGTLQERLEQSRTRIATMCADLRGPRMSIPVRATDDDYFICLTLQDAIEALNATQSATAHQRAIDDAAFVAYGLRKFGQKFADTLDELRSATAREPQS